METPDGACAPQNWPVPVDWPLYVSVERAAGIAGVSYETMSSWVNSRVDPIPHLAAGRSKKLVRVSAIPAYAMTREAS